MYEMNLNDLVKEMRQDNRTAIKEGRNGLVISDSLLGAKNLTLEEKIALAFIINNLIKGKFFLNNEMLNELGNFYRKPKPYKSVAVFNVICDLIEKEYLEKHWSHQNEFYVTINKHHKLNINEKIQTN